MSTFNGKYDLVKSENFEEYMSEIGVGFVMRKLGSRAKPQTEITEADGNWNITTKTTFKTTEIKFKLGEPFDEETADGRKCKATITKEGEDTLVHKQDCGGKNYEIIRKFQGDEMIMVLKAGDVTSVRTYKKAK